jgi:hypothetical protein
MQTWAKRGIQSAFVTGGLLMLGTGIASAQENVNPDAAPSPVDAGVSVPVKVDQNSLGTPAKSLNAPKIDRTISTDRVTSAVPTRTAAPVAHPLVRQLSAQAQGTAAQNTFRGNRVQAYADAPIMACGNAIAVGRNAEATGDCTQESHRDTTYTTDGRGQALAGNVVAADWVAPFQITGNAIGAGGNATAATASTQNSTTGGDRVTSGEKGSVSGNIVSGQWATPFQITGNSVGGAGIGESSSTADTTAKAYGEHQTSGENGSLSGNVGAIPLAPLSEVNGNSVAGVGNTTTDSTQSGVATAGEQRGTNDIPAWVKTNGDPATLSGNVAQPQLAGPITIDDNAGAVGGNADATSATTNESTTGGHTYTSGDGSTGSGNVADAPIALPVSAGGNGGSLLGNAFTDHSNESSTTAGSEVYSNGDNSVLSGNLASVPPATAVDLCGNGVAGAGQAGGTCENDVKSSAGGHNGTLGNDSVGSGNVANTPLAAPVEVYGLAGAAAGTATGSADEVKDVRSSGIPTTNDDWGTVSSNIVTTPTAVAPQVFGDTVGVVGNTKSDTANDTSVTAGAPAEATGKESSVSGNIVQVPSTTPAQVFGNGATLVGNNSAKADNATDMQAGGDAVTTGEAGSIAGNVISAPVASATQIMGWSVAGGGNVDSASTNDLDSIAGGEVNSNGDGGSLSGNLIGAQATPFVPSPGNSVSAAGITKSDADTDTVTTAGGDSFTHAEDASASGNLIHVPANAAAQVYADAIAVLGQATTDTEKVSYTRAGGLMETEGSGPLTAREMTVPVEAVANVRRIAIEVLGQALTQGTSDDTQITGEEEGTLRASQLKGIQLHKGVDSLMKANEVPAFHRINQLPVNNLPSPEGLTGLAGQLPVGQLPASQLPVLGQLPVSKLPTTKLPTTKLAAPKLPSIAQERSALPVNGGVANVTPNVQGLPLGQVLEAAQALVPAGATGRSLPSLPVTAPALPVPVQLPALPTERSLPALPLDGPASISGLNLNATEGLAPQERALPQLPMDAPALALIDPVNVFERVTGSL